ncbi:MAG TPA: alpha/beta hydrolase, partial [Candidatus Saccharimonadales bacterium]
PFNAARYLDKQGFSTLRVSFYGFEDNQRDISDYDVNVGAEDIDTIVDYVKKKGVKWVAVVGHSYSGMAIVYSNKQRFDTAVLWDPSHSDSYSTLKAQLRLKEDFTYIKEINAYVSPVGSGQVISSKVFDSSILDSVDKSKKFKIPTLIINASWSKEMKEYGKKYADSINAPTKRVVIPNSTHPFVEDGAMDKLFEITTKWVKQQLNKS